MYNTEFGAGCDRCLQQRSFITRTVAVAIANEAEELLAGLQEPEDSDDADGFSLDDFSPDSLDDLISDSDDENKP